VSRALVWSLAIVILVAAVALIRTLPPPRPELPIIDSLGGDFSLPSTLGRDVSLSDLEGKLVLLNFGYTTCPDVCPAALSRMREVLKAVDPQAEQLQLVFITIDPERDTVDKLRDYLAYFDPSFIGMGGNTEHISQAAALFKVYFEKEMMASDIAYGFAHSDQIYLLDRQGRVRATFGSSVTPAQMAADVQGLLDSA
jgi:protein SCO1/2